MIQLFNWVPLHINNQISPWNWLQIIRIIHKGGLNRFHSWFPKRNSLNLWKILTSYFLQPRACLYHYPCRNSLGRQVGQNRSPNANTLSSNINLLAIRFKQKITSKIISWILLNYPSWDFLMDSSIFEFICSFVGDWNSSKSTKLRAKLDIWKVFS